MQNELFFIHFFLFFFFFFQKFNGKLKKNGVSLFERYFIDTSAVYTTIEIKKKIRNVHRKIVKEKCVIQHSFYLFLFIVFTIK